MKTKEKFDPDAELIYIEGYVYGPLGVTGARLVLDTGATETMLDESLLLMLGYDTSAGELSIVHTGGGSKQVRSMKVTQFDSLGAERRDFPIQASKFPPWFGFEGIVGLSFLRETRLIIDFSSGQIELVDAVS